VSAATSSARHAAADGYSRLSSPTRTRRPCSASAGLVAPSSAAQYAARTRAWSSGRWGSLARMDVTGVVDTGVPTTAPNYPTLTPTSTKEAYFGLLSVPGSVSAGSTPGVVYQVDARGNQCAYAESVSSTITPVASGSSQTFFSIGLLLKAV
jgi:hypothetical protein